MQKILPFLIVASLVWQGALWAQEESPKYPQLYSTSGFETVFSFADMQKDGNNINTILRFAPVINFQSMVNYHLNQTLG